jgi:hypothetical protein
MVEKLKIGGSILAIAIVAPFLWWSWGIGEPETAAPEPPPDPEDQLRAEARVACQEWIRPRLRDPGSAEWGWRDEGWSARWPAEVHDGGEVEVLAGFRAANALGGLIWSEWHCRVEIDQGAGTVTLRDLREL